MSAPGPAIFAVIGVAFVAFAGLGIYLSRRQKKRIQKHVERGEYQKISNPAIRRVFVERDQKLAREVALRDAQERDSSAGSQVWFSRYVEGGNLKHWILGINGKKYELRRDDTSPTKRYTYNVADWTIDQEKREQALAVRKVPEVDGYYVCLIGWTMLPASELQAICAEIMAGFGTYHLLWNNCHDFLQKFADRIVSKKALDWNWFRENTATEYQNNQKWPPPPPEIVAMQMAMMQQQQNINQQNQIQQQQIQQNMMLQNQTLSLQTAQMNNIMLNNMMVNNQMMMGGGGGGA